MDEQERQGPLDPDGNGGRRRRRRRRRRRGEGPEGGGGGGDWGDDVLAAEGEERPAGAHSGGGQRGRGRNHDGPSANVPASGKNPFRKRSTRARRSAPSSAVARRRKLSRDELGGLQTWLGKLSDRVLHSMYRGLGGQPGRVEDRERLLQLVVRAVAQGNRLGGLVRQLHDRDRKALATLVQCGGVAHSEELHRELAQSYGGHERDWVRSCLQLADRGVLFGTPPAHDGNFFYVVPEPIVDALLTELQSELVLPTFESEEVRILEQRPFCPPLDFSITTLATYIDQRRPRLTQRHEIHRHDQEEMEKFFGQLWEADSDLFSFHIDFLMMHGMVELRGDTLTLNRDVTEEWLQLEPEDQRDLVFRALDKRFPLAEWVLWMIHAAKGAWIAERPLVATYRRWKRGEDWRERMSRGQVAPSRTNDRESYSFAPLVRIGLLEMGQWGQEKFYRLSPRGRQLLEPADDEGFRQFYLTPSFEIMAPAGLAPILLFRIGEIAELVGCDRANTFKITDIMVERALQRGWKRDDVLQFLRDNSQIGVPENVEATLKGWIGHRGDIEFHDLMLITVHRSQIRRLESSRRVKPYLLHRFGPGMYAIDRNRQAEVSAVLKEVGFDPSGDVRRYPGDPGQVEARQQLHKHVAEAREAAIDPLSRGTAIAPPEILDLVPGSRVAKAGFVTAEDPPELTADTPEAVRAMLDKALQEELDLEMTYLAKNGQKLVCKVFPERLAFKADAPVLVGLDRDEKERRTFTLDRIEKLKILGGGGA